MVAKSVTKSSTSELTNEQPERSVATPEVDLRQLTSFDQVIAQYGVEHVLDISSELGDGFALLDSKDKAKLEGIPFFIVQQSSSNGTFGSYSILRIITADNRKLVLIDGSSGIHAQMEELRARFGEEALTKPMLCRNGLRVSEYDYTDESTGEVRPAKTYYLDTSA